MLHDSRPQSDIGALPSSIRRFSHPFACIEEKRLNRGTRGNGKFTTGHERTAHGLMQNCPLIGTPYSNLTFVRAQMRPTLGIEKSRQGKQASNAISVPRARY